VARGRRTIGIVALAAIAILGGTAATLLSSRRGAVGGAGEPVIVAGAPGPRRGGPTVVARDREPSRPASVRVLVLRAADRTPVAGAKVVVRTGPGVVDRTTDAAGAATFSEVLSGPIRVDTVAEGLEPDHRGAVLAPGGNPTVDVLLAESALLEGRVVAAADGAPVAGARVAARVQHDFVRIGIEAGALVASGQPPEEGPSATTASDGSFRIRAGAPGKTVLLDASAEGFAPETASVAIPSTASPVPVEIALSRAGRIRGTIRDTRGNPIEGAAVRAAPGSAAAAAASPFFRRSPGRNSGPDGSFVVEGLAVDAAYTVQSWGGAGGSAEYGRAPLSRPVEVFLPADPGEASVDLVLPLRGSLAVDWSDPSGASDGAARCLAFPLDAAGRVEIGTNRIGGPGFLLDLAEGRYRVVVDSQEHGVGEAEAVVVGEADARVSVVVGTGPALEGIVVDEERRPVSGVRVRAIRPGDAPGAELPDPPSTAALPFPSRGFVQRVSHPSTAADADALPGAALHDRTDAAGRFRIDGALPGTSWLLFVREQEVGVPATGPFEVPTRDIRLVARRCGALQGRLFLPAGAAVPGDRSIHFESGSARVAGEPTLRTTGGFGDGSFRIEGLPPGRGRLWATTGAATLPPVEVVVPAGESADLGVLPMEPTHRLLGVVLDAAGAPVAGAVVRAGGAEPVTTRADGTFSVDGLPRGEAVVWVHPGDGGNPIRTKVPVPTPDGTPSPVEFRFLPSGVLGATARDEAGRPLAGWRVRLRRAGDPASAALDTGAISHRGRLEVHLAAGPWTVSLHPPGARDAAAEQTVEVPAAGRASVEFRGSRK